jgi:tetratricopeptide (TPR) repeat protein
MQYLDALSKESAGDASLERDVGEAYVRVADIQGNPAVANIGDAPAALANYQKARTLLKSAVARNPGDLRANLSLIDMYSKLSLCYGSLKNQTESDKAVQEAVKAAEAARRWTSVANSPMVTRPTTGNANACYLRKTR